MRRFQRPFAATNRARACAKHGLASAVAALLPALWALAWLGILALPACSESDPAAKPPALASETPEPSAVVPAPWEATPTPKALQSDWVLQEFDWGDSEEIVRETIDYTSGFLCFKYRGACRVVRVKVDGEDLLAGFQYHEDGLWRVAIITPPLSSEQLSEHGPRVANRLASHVKRRRGEPVRTDAFPKVAELEAGTYVLRHWEAEDMQIDVVLVLRDGQYFAGVYFADPVRGAEARLTAEDPTAPPEKPKVVRRPRRQIP